MLQSYKEIPPRAPHPHSVFSGNVDLIRSNGFCRLTSQALSPVIYCIPAPTLAAECAWSLGNAPS